MVFWTFFVIMCLCDYGHGRVTGSDNQELSWQPGAFGFLIEDDCSSCFSEHNQRKCDMEKCKLNRSPNDANSRRSKRNLFHSFLNADEGYSTEMYNNELKKYFQIDCSGVEQPNPMYQRKLRYLRLLQKRYVRQSRTTSSHRLPSGTASLKNNSNQNQQTQTPVRKVDVKKQKEVTISNTIGSTNKREQSTSTNYDTSHTIGTEENKETTNQVTKAQTKEHSDQLTVQRSSETSNKIEASAGVDVTVTAGFQGFGLKAEGSVRSHGSVSGSHTGTNTESETEGRTDSNSKTYTRQNTESEDKSKSDSNTTSSGFTRSTGNAVVSEHSTNDAMTVTETVHETLTFTSQEITILPYTEMEVIYDYIEQDVINDYQLDFELDLDATTEAFEFQRKEGICVISAGGASHSLRHFLAMKEDFDKCCSMFFDSPADDDVVVKLHGTWQVRNVPATERQTNFHTGMEVIEKNIKGSYDDGW